MNTVEGKQGLGSLLGPVTELLKNPAVIEGAIAGISAISAARKVKNPRPSGGGFDMSSMIEMLPQILPLISMFSSNGGSASQSGDAADVSADNDGTLPVSALAESEDDIFGEEAEAAVSGNIYNGTEQDKRENLLLALRPFLSESRVAAADAIIQVNRISGLLGT